MLVLRWAAAVAVEVAGVAVVEAVDPQALHKEEGEAAMVEVCTEILLQFLPAIDPSPTSSWKILKSTEWQTKGIRL